MTDIDSSVLPEGVAETDVADEWRQGFGRTASRAVVSPQEPGIVQDQVKLFD